MKIYRRAFCWTGLEWLDGGAYLKYVDAVDEDIYKDGGESWGKQDKALLKIAGGFCSGK